MVRLANPEALLLLLLVPLLLWWIRRRAAPVGVAFPTLGNLVRLPPSWPARMRQALDFIFDAFAADPNRRWPALAHAALLAKHRLHDLPAHR